jgi:hypothetical protein
MRYNEPFIRRSWRVNKDVDAGTSPAMTPRNPSPLCNRSARLRHELACGSDFGAQRIGILGQRNALRKRLRRGCPGYGLLIRERPSGQYSAFSRAMFRAARLPKCSKRYRRICAHPGSRPRNASFRRRKKVSSAATEPEDPCIPPEPSNPTTQIRPLIVCAVWYARVLDCPWPPAGPPEIAMLVCAGGPA